MATQAFGLVKRRGVGNIAVRVVARDTAQSTAAFAEATAPLERGGLEADGTGSSRETSLPPRTPWQSANRNHLRRTDATGLHDRNVAVNGRSRFDRGDVIAAGPMATLTTDRVVSGRRPCAVGRGADFGRMAGKAAVQHLDVKDPAEPMLILRRNARMPGRHVPSIQIPIT